MLHRIIGIYKGGFVMCGDNRTVPEYVVKKKQVIGVLTDIIRDGKTLPVDELTRELRLKNASDLMYLICHMYKHYIHGGTGLRNLADIVAYTERHDPEPFNTYIRDELHKPGVLDFERRMYEPAYSAVNGAALNKEQEDLLLELEGAGTYGSLEIAEYHSMIHSLGGDDSRRSKTKHLIKRIFRMISTFKSTIRQSTDTERCILF